MGSAFYGFPRAPWGTFCYLPTMPPAGRASHLESQLMAIRYGLTAPPEPLRLPQPTWMPPTTQNRRWVQLPPPPPKTDSVQRLTRVSRQRPQIRGLRDKEPSDLGEPGHVAVIMDPPHRCLVSHTPPNRLRDALVERLGGLPTGTRWPIFRTTVAGVGKKTWTYTWEPTLGSITGRSQPPSGPN